MARESGGGERGTTLIEMVVSIAIIGIVVAGTLLLVQKVSVHSADPLIERQALAIAQAYLEEILLRPYWDPVLGAGGGACPAPPASRALFDNVCDYQGLDDAGAADQSGAPVAGLAAYRVRVAVDAAAALGDLSGPADALRVDVRVTHPASVDLRLSGFRARY
jgi:MSHA pilin protein MshD